MNRRSSDLSSGKLLFPVVCRQWGGAEAFLEAQNPSGSPGRLYHGAAVDDGTIEKLPVRGSRSQDKPLGGDLREKKLPKRRRRLRVFRPPPFSIRNPTEHAIPSVAPWKDRSPWRPEECRHSLSASPQPSFLRRLPFQLPFRLRDLPQTHRFGPA